MFSGIGALHWRWVVQVTVATALAGLLVVIPSWNEALDGAGYWSVATAAVVVESTAGASLQKCVERVIGTAAGGIFAYAVYVTCTWNGKYKHNLPSILLLTAYCYLLPVPWGVMKAKTNRFPLVPVYATFTGYLVVLAGYVVEDEKQVMRLAFFRIGAVVLGVVISSIVCHSVFPNRARHRVKRGLAEIFDAAADMLDPLIDMAAGLQSRRMLNLMRPGTENLRDIELQRQWLQRNKLWRRALHRKNRLRSDFGPNDTSTLGAELSPRPSSTSPINTDLEFGPDFPGLQNTDWQRPGEPEPVPRRLVGRISSLMSSVFNPGMPAIGDGSVARRENSAIKRKTFTTTGDRRLTTDTQFIVDNWSAGPLPDASGAKVGSRKTSTTAAPRHDSSGVYNFPPRDPTVYELGFTSSVVSASTTPATLRKDADIGDGATMNEFPRIDSHLSETGLITFPFRKPLEKGHERKASDSPVTKKVPERTNVPAVSVKLQEDRRACGKASRNAVASADIKPKASGKLVLRPDAGSAKQSAVGADDTPSAEPRLSVGRAQSPTVSTPPSNLFLPPPPGLVGESGLRTADSRKLTSSSSDALSSHAASVFFKEEESALGDLQALTIRRMAADILHGWEAEEQRRRARWAVVLQKFDKAQRLLDSQADLLTAAKKEVSCHDPSILFPHNKYRVALTHVSALFNHIASLFYSLDLQLAQLTANARTNHDVLHTSGIGVEPGSPGALLRGPGGEAVLVAGTAAALKLSETFGGLIGRSVANFRHGLKALSLTVLSGQHSNLAVAFTDAAAEEIDEMNSLRAERRSAYATIFEAAMHSELAKSWVPKADVRELETALQFPEPFYFQMDRFHRSRVPDSQSSNPDDNIESLSTPYLADLSEARSSNQTADSPFDAEEDSKHTTAEIRQFQPRKDGEGDTVTNSYRQHLVPGEVTSDHGIRSAHGVVHEERAARVPITESFKLQTPVAPTEYSNPIIQGALVGPDRAPVLSQDIDGNLSSSKFIPPQVQFAIPAAPRTSSRKNETTDFTAAAAAGGLFAPPVSTAEQATLLPWETLVGIDVNSFRRMSGAEHGAYWEMFWRGRDRLSVVFGTLSLLRDQMYILCEVVQQIVAHRNSNKPGLLPSEDSVAVADWADYVGTDRGGRHHHYVPGPVL